MNKEQEELIVLCSKAFIMWMMEEHSGVNSKKRGDDLTDCFICKILDKKFEVFDIDIHIPDFLMLILDVCVQSNPGQVQIVLKKLLEDIKKRTGPIPAGYVIKSTDFAMCFQTKFPLMINPKINKEYEILWDAQKCIDKNTNMSYNLCDTKEWWKEVME